MLDPALMTGALHALQRAINFGLGYDPGTQANLHALNGKHLCLRSPQLTVHVLFESGKVVLHSYSEAPIDCELTGELSDIAALAWRDNHSLANTGVEVRGDLAVLGRVQALSQQLDLDWEEAINDLMGDSAGHLLATLLRRQWSWMDQRRKDIPKWLPEYLSEELHVVPSQFELQQFYQSTHKLQQDVDRAAARLDKLQRAIASKLSGSQGAKTP